MLAPYNRYQPHPAERFKMAAEGIQVNSASPDFADSEDKFDRFQCQSCIFMKSEFEVLTNEVKSLSEVISVLKEEVNYYSAKS